MKDIATYLYPNEQVAGNVGKYAYGHSTGIPQHMLDHHAWATENHPWSMMMISPLQAQFQIWMVKALGAKRILEIGCFIGFSAMGWSHAVGVDGHVTTLEFSPDFAKVADEVFKKNSIQNVDIVIGDARESLKTISSTTKEPFDLIFIDADKTSYPTYLSLILELSKPSTQNNRLLRPGGIIMADNVLKYGLVADASDANPWSKTSDNVDTEALDQFNKMMLGEGRLETFLMPMFDGLGMARLKD